MTFREWLLDKSSLLSGTLMQHLNNIADNGTGTGNCLLTSGIEVLALDIKEIEEIDLVFNDIEEIDLKIEEIEEVKLSYSEEDISLDVEEVEEIDLKVEG